MPANYFSISRLCALLALFVAVLALLGVAANVPLITIAVVLLAFALLIP